MILVGLATTAALLLSWWTLATVYLPFVWLFSRVVGRPVSAPGAWKMASAALLVGATVGTIGIAAYATGAVRLPGLLVSQALHLPVGWIWLLWGILSRPAGTGPVRRSPAKNPFA